MRDNVLNPRSELQINAQKCSGYEKDILKDVDRTFTDSHEFSQKNGPQRLFNVLKAISNNLVEVGYIQGWNSIISVLILSNLDDHSIYWIIIYLMKRMKTINLYTNNLEGIEILTYQIQVCMKSFLPEIYDKIVMPAQQNNILGLCPSFQPPNALDQPKDFSLIQKHYQMSLDFYSDGILFLF